jgi:hypothetical protein
MSSETRSVLSRIVERLDQAGVPFMVAGSFASTYHGVPRTTNDIDIVIAPTEETLRAFLRLLPEQDYYVSPDAAFEALRRRTMFNVIDMETGWKMDLIIRKGRPFSQEEFRRRITARLFDVPVYLATAEDTILSKLEWASLGGGSERQIRDAQGIITVKADHIDRAYLERWVEELGVEDLWRRLG